MRSTLKLYHLFVFVLMTTIFSGCQKEEGSAILSTIDVKIITSTTAASGGNIKAASGSEVYERGVCWGTSSTPTIDNNKTIDSTGIGMYISLLTGLTPATTYYVRAYAATSGGTDYGNEVRFTTPDSIKNPTQATPIIKTLDATNITITTAVVEGMITSDGNTPVLARGICWGTTPTPTINNNTTNDGVGSGNYKSNLAGLNANTTYYVRAYATNIVGTSYGNEISFTTCQPN